MIRTSSTIYYIPMVQCTCITLILSATVSDYTHLCKYIHVAEMVYVNICSYVYTSVRHHHTVSFDHYSQLLVWKTVILWIVESALYYIHVINGACSYCTQLRGYTQIRIVLLTTHEWQKVSNLSAIITKCHHNQVLPIALMHTN